MNAIKPTFVMNVCLLLICFMLPQAYGQESSTEIINDLKPVLDCQTVALINIPMGEFKFEKSIQQILNLIGDVPSGIQKQGTSQAESAENAVQQLITAGAVDVSLIRRMGTLIEQEMLIAFRCKDEESAKDVSKRLEKIHYSFYGNIVKKNLVLVGWRVHEDVDFLLRLPRIQEDQLQSLTRSLDEVEGSPIRMVFTLSPDQKKALLAGGGEQFSEGSAASINNFQHLSIGLNLLERQLVIQMRTADKESAAAIASKAKDSLRRFAASQEVAKNLPSLSKWLSQIELPSSDNKISLKFEGEEFDSMIRSLSQPVLLVLKRQNSYAPLLIYDPTGIIPGWWTDHLVPVYWTIAAGLASSE